jgi:ABC-type multidrug transport system ATPase subunit
VTDHIKKVWKEHPIKITFDISESQISFHVHDEGVNEKAKTADQRSDGFRQFISFLLTVSAENKSGALSDTILLLDEPETHLHPKAQENLLNDLIQITSDKERNNTVFFATHSNYMIDKKDLGRNMKIKKDNNKTKLEFFDTKESTHGSVNYEVFDILSTDYHNELYAKLHELYQGEDESDEKRARILNFDDNFLSKKGKGQSQDKPWMKDEKRVTLSTYIRNCIHHPDNGNTYSEEEMRKSIGFLHECLFGQSKI